MLYLGENSSAKTRVNVLKKVKVNGAWKFCPVVVEPNGKLKNKVRVNGRAEVHTKAFTISSGAKTSSAGGKRS